MGAWKNNIDVSIAQKICDIYSVPLEYVFGKEFMLEIPVEQWHRSKQEDYKNAKSEVKDYLLFKYGKGYFISHTITPEERKEGAIERKTRTITPEEDDLLNLYELISKHESKSTITKVIEWLWRVYQQKERS